MDGTETKDIPAIGAVTSARGINLLVLDPSLKKVLSQRYDTWADSAAATALATTLLAQPYGHILIMGVVDEGSEKLKLNGWAKMIIKLMGSHLIDTIGYRESWVFIGRRGGDAAGLVQEDHGKVSTVLPSTLQPLPGFTRPRRSCSNSLTAFFIALFFCTSRSLRPCVLSLFSLSIFAVWGRCTFVLLPKSAPFFV